MDINTVFQENEKWIQSKLDLDENYFTDLSKGQQPAILYIGCSDSRVTAEEMMGAGPGEIFVHRNVANVVSNMDVSAMSVINYAVVHLKVQHLVVCGHYFCGGVKAAMGADNLGIINPWLKNIRDVYRLHQEELDAISDEEARYKRLVERNVQEQCVNALKNPEVQAGYNNGTLQIHGWVFDISTGKIIDLEVDLQKLQVAYGDIFKVNG